MPAYRTRPCDAGAARELGRACRIGPAAAQVLLHRGMAEPAAASEFLDAKLSGLTPPDAMADRDAAADRIARAVKARERIAVFGDYDVDGTTSACILADVLEALGGDVAVLCANRFEGGYGFSDAALARCRAAGARLIVTCDVGSSDHERIAAAARAGIDVIVVDHHLVPREPLPAFAFLNPHRPECGFPYKGLCSAGLALSVGAAVRRALGATLDLRTFLDLVALGTIADVAPLDGDNRRLVRAGLRLLTSPRARPGVVALCEAARIRPFAVLGAADVAFRLAPRLNAAGRLGDPALTLGLLRARSLAEARPLAARLERTNDERKAIERAVTAEAIAQVEAVYGPAPRSGVVVAGAAWHRGVVGITAARLVDRFGVPAIAISLEGGVGHGSGRAPPRFPLYDAVHRCGELLLKYGGHHAAAGLSIEPAGVESLRAAFADATLVERGLFDDAPGAGPLVDVELDPALFPMPTLADLQRLEPTGERNAEAIFALPEAKVLGRQVVGSGHLALSLRYGESELRALGWEMATALDSVPDIVSPVGWLRADGWRGGDALELRLLSLA